VPTISFPYREDKAADAAALLLELSGGSADLLRIVKLLYLADRHSLATRGRPVTGDRYVSMDLGPVGSHTYDLMKDQVSVKPLPTVWAKRLRREHVRLAIAHVEPLGALSAADERVLRETHEQFKDMTTREIIRHTHTLPEWRDPHGSSLPIETDELMRIVGIPDDDIAETARETAYMRQFTRALGA